MNTLFKPQDRDALYRQARERALEEAERRWPPSHLRERQREADDLTIKYYREYTGATP